MNDTLFGKPIAQSRNLPIGIEIGLGDYSEYMRVTVHGCARCGGEHVDLKFSRMSEPTVDEDGTWTHFSKCPFTDEIILMRIINH